MSYVGKLGVVSMASAVSVTSVFTFQNAYSKVGIGIPTMASGSDVYLQGSPDGTTFTRIFFPPAQGAVTPTAVSVTSGVTNCIVQMDGLPTKYIRLQLSTATTDTPYTFTIYGSD